MNSENMREMQKKMSGISLYSLCINKTLWRVSTGQIDAGWTLTCSRTPSATWTWSERQIKAQLYVLWMLRLKLSVLRNTYIMCGYLVTLLEWTYRKINSSGQWSKMCGPRESVCVLPTVHYTFCFSRKSIVMRQLSVEQSRELVS